MATNIDLNTLYKQGKATQFGVAALIILVTLGIGYVALFKDQWSEIETLQGQEEQLKQDYANKAAQAANLPVLEEELKQIRTAFNVLLKQLPTDAEIPNLIQELHQAGAKNSMRMNSVKPLPPINDDSVQQLPHEISISGSYEQIAQFTRDVGRLSRIVTLDKISLVPSNEKEGNNGVLTLSANANTYKALEINEAAASSASAAE
ncbi:type 4a pilus biogenesis protein PilO [Neisseria shayeganii]|uniref:Type IV pilus assembly protein PilO n=1 Tax=Neisseria shayeganii 871 TaxID=1032488 RepID=G4CET0_9NEIS|nr:type 4a pilus biogenesis protein PilO [Neisseria shayeganii]EGY53665.1 type IV pilus assembly protein PilO [Neisseria shayeganii 871]